MFYSEYRFVKSDFLDNNYKPYFDIIEKSNSNIPIIDAEKNKRLDIF